MSQTLDGKTAIVTGASRGIGKAIALQLAADGADVVLAARSEEPGTNNLPGSLKETAGIIESMGRKATSVRCDVTNDDDLQALVDEAYGGLQHIDILVNNAGGAGPRSLFLEGNADSLDFNYRLNIRAPWLLTQLVGRRMAEAGGGAVINLSSGAARNQPPPKPGDEGQTRGWYIPAYGTTKAALDRWMTAVAGELMAKNIAIINVNPGFTITERVLANPGSTDINRGERPETTAKVISYLCHDPMKYTGQILTSRAFFDEHKLE